MKAITWNDNTCSVGRTSIHGVFTHEEIMEFKTRLTDFQNIPTKYKAATNEFQGYITFAEDEAGIAFLTELALSIEGFERIPRTIR